MDTRIVKKAMKADHVNRRGFFKFCAAAGVAAGIGVVPLFAAPAAPKKVALIDQKKCIKCGTCAKKCPVKAISKTEKEKKFTCLVDPKKCVGCGTCVKGCPVKAITLVEKTASAKG